MPLRAAWRPASADREGMMATSDGPVVAGMEPQGWSGGALDLSTLGKPPHVNGGGAPAPAGALPQGHAARGVLADSLSQDICRVWAETGTCPFGERCQFAHSYSKEPPRPNSAPNPFRPKVCREFARTGVCPYGTRCRFSHSPQPLAWPGR